jgi:EXPERA (EXPanded EBP superfamily)
MKSLHGGTRHAMFVFFSSHIIFTLIVDGQAIFPKHLYPTILQDLLSFYLTNFNDPLMKHTPLWFKSIVYVEFLVQFPFFFIACYYLASEVSNYPAWFRSACITYGAHTSTTMIPILTALATNSAASPAERFRVLSIYLPYLVFPSWLWYIAVTDEEKKKNV